MRLPFAATMACLLALPVAGSLLESSTGGEVAYQFDAGTHHDAPDTCLASATDWSWTPGTVTEAMLVPGDDAADHFLVDVPATKVGARLQVRLDEALASPDLDLMVWAPDCAGTVFDEANQPAPEPTPPAPGPNEARQDVDNLGSAWDCDPSGWAFLVNQLGNATAPATIHVAWTDGTALDLALTRATGGTAHYNATTPLQTLPKGAWINLPSAWSGNFLIGAGPCDATDGGAVYGDAATLGDDVIEFTPVREGLHVVQVTLGTAPPSLATSVPATCHFCVPGGQALSRSASFRVTGAWR